MFENIFPKYITAKNIIFFILAILFIIFIFKISDVAIMFFASFVIACSLEPMVKKLMVKFSRKTACSIVLFGSLFIFLSFFISVVIISGNQIKTFALSLPQSIDNIKEFLYSIPFINQATLDKIDINGLISSVSGTTSKIVADIYNAGVNIGTALVYFIISILIIYYFMIDREKVKNTFLRLFPVPMRKKTAQVLSSIAERSGGYIIAQLVTMASVGLIVTVGLLIIRSEYAIVLGLITAVLDIIPVVGPALAFIICMIVLYKSGPVILIFTAIIFAIAQLVENNFVRPYVFSKFLDLHPLLIYLFLFIAAKYMGLIGVVFAPAIAATVVVLIEEVYMKSLE
ncbi:AI-2E family transporter [bacterium]|nr:AI-2E family transporter [bacterium]